MVATGVPQAPVQVTAHHDQTLISDVPVQRWDYKREDGIPVWALEDTVRFSSVLSLSKGSLHYGLV